MWHVRTTLLMWQSSTCSECVSVALGICHAMLMAPYHLWPAPLYKVSPTLSPKRHDFGKKVSDHKMRVSSFSTTFVWDVFHSKKKWARYDHKCISVFMYSTGYSGQILMKLEFCRQISTKHSDIKFLENPSGGSRFFPMRTGGRKDGHTDRLKEADSRFSRFCRSA